MTEKTDQLIEKLQERIKETDSTIELLLQEVDDRLYEEGVWR